MSRVRRFGGVLEHPITSRLWFESSCRGWGIRDEFGGVLVPVAQSAFGHRARKHTGLYMVGIDVPEIPQPGETSTTVERMCKAERERTPFELALWLVNLVDSVSSSFSFADAPAVTVAEVTRSGAAASGAAGACSHPDGNHGDNNKSRQEVTP
jgi:hypothetical protein